MKVWTGTEGNKSYSISTSNYHRKKPLRLKLIADFMLVTIPIIESALIALPDFPGKEWISWGWATFASLFKVISKFIAEHQEELV